jgi:hypothetical protein
VPDVLELRCLLNVTGARVVRLRHLYAIWWKMVRVVSQASDSPHVHIRDTVMPASTLELVSFVSIGDVADAYLE